jgi:hypothetical protein
MSAADKKSRCGKIAPILVFYACDEVSESERQLINEHLAVCASCAEQLAGERSLWEAMDTSNPPAGWLCGRRGAAQCWFSLGFCWAQK